MKKIVIVGGGNVGYYLAKSLLEGDYEITLIEIQKLRCNYVADMLDVTTYYGDGTSLSTLRKAKVQDADVFIAVTGLDQDNFVACQLAKKYFHIKKTMAKANNPKNAEAMEKLAADKVVSSINMLTTLIESQI